MEPAKRRSAAAIGVAIVILIAGAFIATRGGTQSPGAASATASATASETETGADFGELESIPIESGPPAGPGRTARENLHPGTDKWQLPLTGTGEIEGYFDDVSVAPGESFGLHVRSGRPIVNVSVFRLGSYAGLGARLVARWPNLAVRSQPAPVSDATTGTVVANWDRVLTITVPNDWPSGLYLAELHPAGNPGVRIPGAVTGSGAQYATFIVRETAPVAPILWVSATTTNQAYNNWGGRSLYPDNSTGAPTISGDTAAVTVSFDRPYADYRGAGRVLRWEYPFIRWVEGAGYDVAYAADLDLERHPEIAAGRRLIMVVGHPEYWSPGMRRTLESAIAAGTNVTFFSANEIYWRARFDTTGTPYRTVTCYRRAARDPLAASQPSLATTQWREQPAPDPENQVIGQMYGHQMEAPADWVVSHADHWIYAGTGLANGDRLANLVGQEYDQYWQQLAPAGVTILAISPVRPIYGQSGVPGTPGPNEPPQVVQNATIYQAPSGATVFAAGTMQWGWALDPWGSPEYRNVHTPVDGRVKLITTNILDRLGR